MRHIRHPLPPGALIEKDAEEIPTGSSHIINLVSPSHIDELTGVEGLIPSFVRRRSSPFGHDVATDEVEAEMYDRGEKDIVHMKDLTTSTKAEKEEPKDEPWALLAELSFCAMCGFGNPTQHSPRAYTKRNGNPL